MMLCQLCQLLIVFLDPLAVRLASSFGQALSLLPGEVSFVLDLRFSPAHHNILLNLLPIWARHLLQPSNTTTFKHPKVLINIGGRFLYILYLPSICLGVMQINHSLASSSFFQVSCLYFFRVELWKRRQST
jgi:hypothetical protein